MILALGLRSQGYGGENPERTPPSKFFGVPQGVSMISLVQNQIW